MRVVLQRVSQAAVHVDGELLGSIGAGLLLLVGVAAGDSVAEAELLAQKCAELRIFNDRDGKFNLSLQEAGGAALVVSQFTLLADLRRGRRPSFSSAAAPELAAPLVEHFAATLRSRGILVAGGRFGAMMQVSLINDGPVTIVFDSELYKQPRRTRDVG